MKRWLIVLVVLVIGLVFWLYKYVGLGDYIGAVRAIRKLDAEKTSYAVKEFYGNRSNRTYGGILAGVWTGRVAGVWMWTDGYLKFFPTDEHSIFSSVVGCKPEILNQVGKPGAYVRIGRTVETDINAWSGKVKTGDFVSVMVAGEGNEGKPGKLRELWSNDWWYFLQEDLRTACTR